MNVGACIARPRKGYDFAGTFDKNTTFPAGRSMIAPTFAEASTLCHLNLDAPQASKLETVDSSDERMVLLCPFISQE